MPQYPSLQLRDHGRAALCKVENVQIENVVHSVLLQYCPSLKVIPNLPKASFDSHCSCSSLSTVRLSGNDEISQAIFSLLRYKQTPSGHTQVSQAEQASLGARVDLATL